MMIMIDECEITSHFLTFILTLLRNPLPCKYVVVYFFAIIVILLLWLPTDTTTITIVSQRETIRLSYC